MDRKKEVCLDVIFLILGIIVLLPMIFAFQGSSSSYTTDIKFDIVTGTQADTQSTSFLQRFIGGFQNI